MEPVKTIEASQDHHHALVLATLCVANFMATLDLFVVNVALTTDWPPSTAAARPLGYATEPWTG
jgi:hypothetical protein